MNKDFTEDENTTSSRKQSLFSKLMLWFLLLTTLPVSLVSFISYNQAKTSLRQAAIDELEQTSSLTVRYIQDWFDHRVTDLSSHSSDLQYRDLFASLVEGFQFSERSLQEYVYSYDWASRVDTYQSGLINLRKKIIMFMMFFLSILKVIFYFLSNMNLTLVQTYLQVSTRKHYFQKRLKRAWKLSSCYFLIQSLMVLLLGVRMASLFLL